LVLVCEKGARPLFPPGGKRGLTPYSLVTRERRMPLEVTNGAWRQRAREHALDVAFVVGDVAVEALDGLARHGTRRYRFGEEHAVDERAAGRREVVDGEPVTASGIRVRMGEGRADRVAYRSWSRTQPYSIDRNRRNVFMKAKDFLARALRDL